jgi:hypothetical protein
MTTKPIPIFNSNWLSTLSQWSNLQLFIFSLTGISLNTLILVINHKKKREPDQTYRVIIVYQVVVGIVEDIGKLLSTALYVLIRTCCPSSHCIQNCNIFKFEYLVWHHANNYEYYAVRLFAIYRTNVVAAIRDQSLLGRHLSGRVRKYFFNNSSVGLYFQNFSDFWNLNLSGFS